MSTLMVRKFSKFVHGHFEDFLVVEFLVGDICKNRHNAKKQVQQYKNRNKNLINVKLVHKISTES